MIGLESEYELGPLALTITREGNHYDLGRPETIDDRIVRWPHSDSMIVARYGREEGPIICMADASSLEGATANEVRSTTGLRDAHLGNSAPELLVGLRFQNVQLDLNELSLTNWQWRFIEYLNAFGTCTRTRCSNNLPYRTI
jgi:hypothetical protein